MPKAKKGKQKAGEEPGLLVKAPAPPSKVITASPALVNQFPAIQSSQVVTPSHANLNQPRGHGNHQHSVTRVPLEEVAEEEEEAADNYGGHGLGQ